MLLEKRLDPVPGERYRPHASSDAVERLSREARNDLQTGHPSELFCELTERSGELQAATHDPGYTIDKENEPMTDEKKATPTEAKTPKELAQWKRAFAFAMRSRLRGDPRREKARAHQAASVLDANAAVRGSR